ncbi:hypothetical protein [Marinimicrobium sp. ABcell2]|uniref:hypothetical protein n=1 Tax=Marinimicrobium sp. ABcell2 TaxID=3069751 RepID=UPI0027B49CB8|nr:hypothetical protein [Marinimicrobium sp. ABcell2]MDQ2077362.1 hypothetical protein [Marinimicrobium sp. ABcell2]
MSNKIYCVGIFRLVKKATQLGVTLPHDIWSLDRVLPGELVYQHARIYKTKLAHAVMDHIEDQNIRYVFRLFDRRINPPQWHCIQYPLDCILDRVDDLEALRSKEAATAHVLGLIAEQGIVDFSTTVNDSGIVYTTDDGEILATISEMEFATPPDTGMKKAQQLLRNASSGKSEKELFELFAAFFGVTANYDLDDPGAPMHSYDYAVCTSLGSLARSIKKAFRVLSIEISMGHAQELTAAFFNFDSWNRLIALERTSSTGSIHPMAVSVYRFEDQPEHLFFASPSEALCHFRTMISPEKRFEINVCEIYGTIDLYQPPRIFEHWIFEVPVALKLRCYSIPQIDRYDIDESTPIGRL